MRTLEPLTARLVRPILILVHARSSVAAARPLRGVSFVGGGGGVVGGVVGGAGAGPGAGAGASVTVWMSVEDAEPM